MLGTLAVPMATRQKSFPIVEIYGYPVDATSPEAQAAWAGRRCPFKGGECEKYRQYRFGYCSVTYAAESDQRAPQTYAVCDHRLDGAPLRHVIADHFKQAAPSVEIVPEVTLEDPDMSFDYAAVARVAGSITDVIAIETQAIDLRGGGVGPAWQAWLDEKASDWRAYYTAEATRKGRRDTVAYGVNMANIYKRLGLQVAIKGGYLRGIGVPFYVLMQDLPFQYLRRRIKFATGDGPWDITFITFEYTGARCQDGSLAFEPRQVARTTVAEYVEAMAPDAASVDGARQEFIARVERKSRSRGGADGSG